MNSTHLRANNRRRRNHFDNGVTFAYSNASKMRRTTDYFTIAIIECKFKFVPSINLHISQFALASEVGLMANVSCGVGIGRNERCLPFEIAIFYFGIEK
ncbi:hypothetical protein T10_13133 [Trichinella papuae]|uniref:Uncharacterized protein n=1 Tax=Trichinella papuae TaxID=268474 RepID=A0A0V1M1Y7_9BILA|nr:hypothetical protein T10_13133 [Trichinella papuae]